MKMKWMPLRVGLVSALVVAACYGCDAKMPRQGKLVACHQRVSF